MAATEAFHYKLFMLLHSQGMFQVMQTQLPNNVYEFMNAHHELMRMHQQFAEAHKEVVNAHVELIRAKEVTCDAPSTPVWEEFEALHIPEPPKLVRQSMEGMITPKKPRVKRELFPALDCSESLEEEEAEVLA